MSTTAIIKDYFSEFSKLVRNQLFCAAILSDYFCSEDTLQKEKQYTFVAKTCMEEIFSQKALGILPPSKENTCLQLSELIFQSQLTLLHIPELFRVYHAEKFIELFSIFIPDIKSCCEQIERFSLPSLPYNRFDEHNADPIFESCLNGFKKCKQVSRHIQLPETTVLESLFLKDIDEEFASFFLINLKYVHCALHFPM